MSKPSLIRAVDYVNSLNIHYPYKVLYLTILAKHGFKKFSASADEMAGWTSMSRRTCQRAIRTFKARNLVATENVRVGGMCAPNKYQLVRWEYGE